MSKRFVSFLMMVFFSILPSTSLVANSLIQDDQSAEGEGRETQNGDFSFANRARELLQESISSLIFQSQYLDLKVVARTAHDLEIKKIFLQENSFRNKLRSFLQNVKIPSNSELLQFQIQQHYFIKQSHFFIPQLDYFIEFGARFGNIERLKKVYETQHILLQNFAEDLQLTKDQGNFFATHILEHLYQFHSSYFIPELKPFVKRGDLHIDEKQVQKILRFLTTYSMRFWGKKNILDQHPNWRLEFKGSHLYFDEVEPLSFMQYCFPSHKQAVDCPHGIEEQIFQHFIDVIAFDETDLQIDNYEETAEAIVHLIPVAKSGGIFSAEVNVAKLKFQEYLPLTFDFSFTRKSQTINFYDSHHIGTKILREAQQQLFKTWMSLTPVMKKNFLTQVEWLDSGRNVFDFEKEFSDLIFAIKPLSLSDLVHGKLSVKNFDFNDSLKKVFVTPTFYSNFGSVQSEMHRYFKVLQIRDLMLHEICHLYQKNDLQCQNAVQLFRQMLIPTNSDNLGVNFIKISNSQPKLELILNRAGILEDERILQQQKVLQKYLQSKGFRINDTRFKKSLIEVSCWEQSIIVGCGQYHNGYRQLFEVNHIFQLENGQNIELRTMSSQFIHLENTTFHDGIFFVRFQFYYENAEFYPNRIKVLDVNTGLTIQTIDFFDRDMFGSEVNLLNEKNEIILQKL